MQSMRTLSTALLWDLQRRKEEEEEEEEEDEEEEEEAEEKVCWIKGRLFWRKIWNFFLASYVSAAIDRVPTIYM
jgi:hypothetical protein